MPNIWTLNAVAHASSLSFLQAYYPFLLSAHENHVACMGAHFIVYFPFPMV